MPTLSKFYDDKSDSYVDSDREIGDRYRAVLNLYPDRAGLRILDVGCGSGGFLRNMIALGHSADGIEISQIAAESARSCGATVLCGNIENDDVLNDLKPGYDVITILDVLEHLFNPAEVLRRLALLLSNDGVIIACVPNAGSIAVRGVIATGNFRYYSSGLFDTGHIRWFTTRNLVDYLKDTDLILDGITGTPIDGDPVFKEFHQYRGGWRILPLLSSLSQKRCRTNPSLWGYQLVFRLQRVHGNSLV